MRPEQLPENKGGRPPPDEVWPIREEELTPQESRTLGHLLYAGIFTGVPQPVYAALLQERDPNDAPELFNVWAVSAERYVEKYAEIYGLNTELLKRWSHQASIELANATVPVLIDERERLAREESWGPAQVADYTQDIIEPIVEIVQQGITSPVEYHSHLVGEAYYMDRDLGDVVPLNSSLVRGIFENRIGGH